MKMKIKIKNRNEKYKIDKMRKRKKGFEKINKVKKKIQAIKIGGNHDIRIRKYMF